MTRFTLSSSLLAAVVAVLFVAQGSEAATVGTPTIYQCQASQFEYVCDDPPCRIDLRAPGDMANAYESFTGLTAASGEVSFKVTLAEGSQLIAFIRTNGGASESSGTMTVLPDTDDTCLSGAAASGSAGAGSATSAAATGATSATSSARNANATDSNDHPSATKTNGGTAASDASSTGSSSISSRASNSASQSAGAAQETGAASTLTKGSFSAVLLAAGIALFA